MTVALWLWVAGTVLGSGLLVLVVAIAEAQWRDFIAALDDVLGIGEGVGDDTSGGERL